MEKECPSPLMDRSREGWGCDEGLGDPSKQKGYCGLSDMYVYDNKCTNATGNCDDYPWCDDDTSKLFCISKCGGECPTDYEHFRWCSKYCDQGEVENSGDEKSMEACTHMRVRSAPAICVRKTDLPSSSESKPKPAGKYPALIPCPDDGSAHSDKIVLANPASPSFCCAEGKGKPICYGYNGGSIPAGCCGEKGDGSINVPNADGSYTNPPQCSTGETGSVCLSDADCNEGRACSDHEEGCGTCGSKPGATGDSPALIPCPEDGSGHSQRISLPNPASPTFCCAQGKGEPVCHEDNGKPPWCCGEKMDGSVNVLGPDGKYTNTPQCSTGAKGSVCMSDDDCSASLTCSDHEEGCGTCN